MKKNESFSRIETVKRFHSQIGMTLAEVAVGAALLSGVVGASGYIIVQSQSMQTRSELISEMDRQQLLQVQKYSNVDWLRSQFPDIESMPADGMNLTWQESSLPVETAMRMNRVCNGTQCSKLVIDLETSPSEDVGSNFIAARRNSQVHIPMALVTGRNQISFNCASMGTQGLSGINFDTLTGTCGQVTGHDRCSSNPGAPFRDLFGSAESCQTVAIVNCAGQGMRRMHLFANNSADNECITPPPP